MEVDNSDLLARKRTRWELSPMNWVKLNVDGAARKEGSMRGQMVKDSKGRMLLAFSSYPGKVSNNTVEVMENIGRKIEAFNM